MTTRLHLPHKVYIKRLWADDWTEVAGLYCDFCKFAASPDVNEAQLSYNFGRVMRAGSDAYANSPALEIDGYYVKVLISQDVNGLFDANARKWIGLVVETNQDRNGLLRIAGSIETGRQTFVCRGLEFLLQRQIVKSAFVHTAAGEVEIGRSIGFNLGPGTPNEAYRQYNQGDVGARGVRIFAENLDDVSAWNSSDIIDYLLAYHPPADKNGVVKVTFALDPTSGTDILQKLTPTLEPEGKSVKQLLDEMVDRRRLMAWRVTYQPITESPLIEIFTFNTAIVNLPSGTAIPANADQQAWLEDDENTIQGLRLTTDDATRYDRVVARGERLGACFTISYTDGVIEKDWADALEAAYNAGASGAAGYGALDDWAKVDANQEYRRDHRFVKVYSYFRVPPNWNGSILGTVVCPDPNEAAVVSTKFWYPGLRFGPRLPLVTEVNYATVASLTTEALADDRHETLRPFAIIYDGSRYYYIDRLSQGSAIDDDLEAGGREWSASLQMQDDALGYILNVSGGPQHKLAPNEYVAADPVDTADFNSDLPWQNVYVTVFCEFDQHVEQKWPTAVPTTDTDALRELTVMVPKARLDYLTPGTIIGINNAGQTLTTTGGYIQDDRTWLKDVARTAFEWYGQTRQAVSGTQHNLITSFEVGTLITFIGSLAGLVEVNSVITSLTFDLLGGSVSVQTQFGELDLAGPQVEQPRKTASVKASAL